jgi:hypothetical protein
MLLTMVESYSTEPKGSRWVGEGWTDRWAGGWEVGGLKDWWIGGRRGEDKGGV